MKGRVTSSARCKQCGRRWAARIAADPGGALLLQCPCGAYVGSPAIQIKWRGKTYNLLYNDRGERLPDAIRAVRALDQIRSQIERDEFQPTYWAKREDNLLFWPTYLDRYLESESKRLLPDGRRATYRAKRALVARMKKGMIEKNIREINEGDIEDFLASEVMTRLAVKTRKDTRDELARIFRRAERRGDIRRIPDIPVINAPRRAIKYYCAAQLDLVLGHIPEEHRPIFEFIRLYACRPGEACGLCWDKVDLFNGEFLFGRTMTDRKLGHTTKNRSEDHMPIIEDFAGILAGVPKGIGANPVFVNPLADPRRNPKRFYQTEFIRRIWREAAEAAGLQPIPVKNIRHSTAHWLLNVKRVSPELVRRILRHSSMAYLDRYARPDHNLLAEALQPTKVIPLKRRQN